MRLITILLLLITVISNTAFSQASNKKAAISQNERKSQATPSKSEIQSQMDEATNELRKEVADLKKQLKETTDPEEKKSLEEQISMLEKQLAMMGGLNKNLSGMSDKTIQEGIEEESIIVPKKDVARINMLPKKILNDAELVLFIKNTNAGVEKIIPPAEKAEALKIYNETKAEYKSAAIVANAASGCWMMGNWEKALFIIGRACLDDMNDADNLNNYAAFLINAGAEQAAIPILEFLNSKYPGNSTILNNIGQAWFGLGDLDNAKKYLNKALELYRNHSMANLTMSNISLAGPNPDTPRAVNFLKASLKENYDPEKEVELTKLGYKITYADIPEFRYPMAADPLRVMEFIESFPENYPTSIGDNEKVNNINRFALGIDNLEAELGEENNLLQKKIAELEIQVTNNEEYRKEYLDPHNCPAWKLAKRSYDLIWKERFGNISPLPAHLWLPVPNPFFEEQKKVITVRETWLDCQEIWAQNVTAPLAELARAWQASNRGNSCTDIDAATNAYLAKKAEIRKKGTELIKEKIRESAHGLDNWLRIVLYSGLGNPPKNDDQLTIDLVSQLDYTVTRKTYRNAEIYYYVSMANDFVEKQSKLKSACDPNTIEDPELAPLVPDKNKILKYDLKCEFKKIINTPVVVYKFECNALKEKSKKRNVKSKKDPVNRGEGRSSTERNRNNSGPMHGVRGPSLFFDREDVWNYTQTSPPLTPETRDLSQFSIEYDKWGNLVGSNFQLNKDETALADPDSVESGIESRWSWNALASAKKGFLNKLIIK